MSYAALLFDLDETLIDSVPYWEMAVAHMLAHVGITVSHEEFMATYAPVAQLSTWLTKYNIDPSRREELRDIRNAKYMELLRTRVTWAPGAVELLKHLKGTAPLGLITGSWMEWVKASDSRLSLLPYFRSVVTADDMGKFSKPHPHGLLLATDRLRVDPKDCVYIGDMAEDMEMAHNAGMTAWIVRGKYTSEKGLKEADEVFANLTEVARALVPKSVYKMP